MQTPTLVPILRAAPRPPNAEVRAFIALVCLLAAAAVGVHAGAMSSVSPLALILLAALGAIGGASPVRVASLRTSFSVADAFVFTALGALGPIPACTVAATGVLGAAIRQPPRRGPIQLAFNLGNVVLSSALAAWCFAWTGGSTGVPVTERLIPLAVAGAVYFVANTCLVTTAVARDSGQSFVTLWRETGLWSALPAAAGLTIAALLIFALESIGAAGLALGVPPCWLMATFYRTQQQRHEAQQFRIAEVESLNQALEDRVAERTNELRGALATIASANEQLRAANEGLKAANRAKDEFLANMSHELRTPLNAVIGFSDLLHESTLGDLSPEQRECVKDIRDSGEHLLRLINDILDLSKIEAGRMSLARTSIDVVRVIREAAAMVRPQASSKQLQLLLDLPSGLIAELDPGMFRQILVNLLSNAVKFTKAGGRVTLHVGCEATDLLVRVEDTGIGIAAEHQARIFDEFYQVDGSYSRNYEGTGLGLALVRRMMQLHGGAIELHSAPGEGSSFTCRFPGCVSGAGMAVVPPEKQEEVARTPGEGTILVVEDHPVNRKLVRRALCANGFDVVEAESGERALEILSVSRPDLVLMDLQLPGLDGLEVTRRMRDMVGLAGVPIVALTAHAHREDECRAYAAGCVGYIAKPIRLSTFAAEIRRHLATSRVPVGS